MEKENPRNIMLNYVMRLPLVVVLALFIFSKVASNRELLYTGLSFEILA